MITPPLSISAMPRFTRAVPRAGAGAVESGVGDAGCGWSDTADRTSSQTTGCDGTVARVVAVHGTPISSVPVDWTSPFDRGQALWLARSCLAGVFDQSTARTLAGVDVDIVLTHRGDLVGEIYRQVRAAVLDGRLRPGQRVPASRELAASLEVSRATVVEAYDRLAGEGFLVSRVGAGTFVSSDVNPSAAWLRRPVQAGTTLKPRPLWDSVTVPDGADTRPLYDFRASIPDARLFPYDTWRRLLGRELHAGEVGDGAYGDPAGHPGLRAAIAAHLGASRGMRVRAEDITITNGTQQAVDLITRVLVDPGDQVAVEDPGYLPPRRLFATLGARVVGVPVDSEGIVVDAVPARSRLVHVSPSHQFPLGTSMSLRRRLALLEWARLHDAAIIEDDYDSEFRFDARPVEPLQTLDPHGRVLYVGSFSKTMLATLRLGFVVAPASLHRAIRAAKYVTDWHTSLPTQAALARFIDEGLYARHLRRMRGVYQARHDRIVEVLGRDFGGLLDVIPSAAGLHLSALAPSADEVAAAVRAARTDGVAVRDLAGYAVDLPAPAGLIVGYGAVDLEDIPDGLALLRRAFDRRTGRVSPSRTSR
jgi:GntR family transcriptional regulator/MocR family aminotransferase